MNEILTTNVKEVEKLCFYFNDYLLVSKAESVNIFYNLSTRNFNCNSFKSTYFPYLRGYSISSFPQSSHYKDLTESVEDTYKITYKSEICAFFTEYRIVFCIDISQSLLTYDYRTQSLNIEKIELYLTALIKVNFL